MKRNFAQKRFLGALAQASAALWLSVAGCEFLSPYQPTLLLHSPILRLGALHALGVMLAALIGVLVLGSVVVVLANSVRLRLALPAPVDSLMAASMALFTSIVVVLNPGDWLVVALYPLLFAFTLMLGASALEKASPRLGRAIQYVLPVGLAAGWLAIVLPHLDAGSLAIVMLGSGLLAILFEVGLAFESNRRRPRWVLPGISVLMLALIIIDDQGPSHTETRDQPHAAGTLPNVLVFMIDTVRADHTGDQQYSLATTPVLDALAEDRATVFSQAWCGATSTVPSIKSLFTSLPATTWGFSGAGKLGPPSDAWTLPKAMRAKGYATAGFTANGGIDQKGFRAGFDEFWSLGGLNAFKRSFLLSHLWAGGDTFRIYRMLAEKEMHKVYGETLLGLAENWLERNEADPFFMYMHIVEPHWPYHDRGYELSDRVPTPADPYVYVDFLEDKKLIPPADDPALLEITARYDQEVRFGDDVLARMLAMVEKHGLSDDTIIVVCADHGESFFEHGVYGHGGQVFQEQAHVPFTIRWPANTFETPPPARIDRPVSLMDILPTFTELLGLKQADVPFAGRSLLPYIRSEASEAWPVTTEAFAPRHMWAGYREGNLIAHLRFSPSESPADTPVARVYDLATDPEQQTKLDPREPRVANLIARARKALQPRWLLWPDRGTGGEDPESSDDDPLDHLRAIGYVD